MSRSTVTLFRVPSAGILATSRQAALLQSLQDACESVSDLKAGVDPAEVINKAMSAEVVEIEGTFPGGDALQIFRVLPVDVPKDWKPAHALDLPAKYGINKWHDNGDSVFSTREDAVTRCAWMNRDNIGKVGACSFWHVIAEEGNPLADTNGERFQWWEASFENGVGLLEATVCYPLRIVPPTAADIELANSLVAEWQDERELAKAAVVA